MHDTFSKKKKAPMIKCYKGGGKNLCIGKEKKE